MFLAYFEVKCSNFLQKFWLLVFCQVNSEGGAYLAVDKSLVYSTFIATLESFYYFSLILTSFSIHISVSFSFYFMLLDQTELEFYH